jgi:hypothetical protein
MRQRAPKNYQTLNRRAMTAEMILDAGGTAGLAPSH